MNRNFLDNLRKLHVRTKDRSQECRDLLQFHRTSADDAKRRLDLLLADAGLINESIKIIEEFLKKETPVDPIRDDQGSGDQECHRGSSEGTAEKLAEPGV